jgi:uncharacterized protein
MITKDNTGSVMNKRLKSGHMRFGNIPRALCVHAIILAVMFLPGVPGGRAWSQQDTCALTIINRHGKAVAVKAERADNEFRRRKGLMFRKAIDANRGMLFVFEAEQYQAFWMRNTYIPLSIAYVDGRGVIREIYDMKPLDDSVTYPSKSRVKYALEMNRGWFSAHDVIPGCRIVLDGCVGK